MKKANNKPYCDCHKADKHFDGNCHYSKYYDNCEHCEGKISFDVSKANLVDALRTSNDAEKKMRKLGYIK